MRTLAVGVPWTNVYGLARSLVATGLALTLIFSSPDVLFSYRLDTGLAPYCGGMRSTLAFCLTGRENLWLVQALCVGVLIIVAIGWRPRWMCIPHWYVHFSFLMALSSPDGGDQIAAILTFLIIPIALTDPRKWHWLNPPSGTQFVTTNRKALIAVAVVFLACIKIQASVIYFQAGVAKLSHGEWADGTAFYYWSSDPTFGVAGWAREIIEWLLQFPPVLVSFAWLPVALEILLGFSLFMKSALRRYLPPMAIGLHLFIAVLMGLWSFAFTMWAMDLILLYPIGATVAYFAIERKPWKKMADRDSVRV